MDNITYNKKSIATGTLISLVMVAFIVLFRESFLDGVEYGKLLLIICLSCAVLTMPAITFKFNNTKVIYYIWCLLFFILVPLVMEIVVERLNGKFITEFYGSGDWIDNYNVILLTYIFLFAITGSFRISVMIASPGYLLFGIVNMFVKEFKGGPFLPQDIASAVTAANVASGYNYEIGYEMVFGVVITVFVMAIASRMEMPPIRKKIKITTRLLCILIIGGYAGLFYGTDTFAKIGYKPDFFNQTRGYERHGASLEFMLNTKYLWLSEPKGYSDADVGEIVEDKISDTETPSILKTALINEGYTEEKATEATSVETAGAQGITPNIIVIMNESYSDLRVDGDFETNEEFMPYVDSLKGSTIQGNAYVSVFGSGTSNTEYEFLTGNSMAFLPAGSNAYQAYIKNQQPGLTDILKSQGYSADAFHPYYSSSWNRVNVYNLMGFNSFTTIEDLIDSDIIDSYKNTGNDYLFIRRVQNRYPESEMLLRRFVSDSYNYQKLEEMYENRDTTKPFYVFNVTMQNHSSYNRHYANFDQEIELTYPAGDYDKTEQYLSLIKKSDEAFEELTDYFSNVDEPTIILMFGDHQPFVETEFYSEVMGESVENMDDETLQNRYITRFILWANYDIPTGWIDKISMNYLSTLLLQTAGLEMSDYNKYLANLYTELPVVSAAGCIDKDGNFFMADNVSDADTTESEDLQNYKYVAYNNVADYDNRNNSIFSIG